MSVKEINIRGRVRPEINIRGSVQKTNGSGGSGTICHTTEEWETTYRDLRSVKGYLYVYSDYRKITDPTTGEVIEVIPRIKIGDGDAYVTDLPFTTMSITDADIARWDNKVSASVDEVNNNLILSTD